MLPTTHQQNSHIVTTRINLVSYALTFLRTHIINIKTSISGSKVIQCAILRTRITLFIAHLASYI